MLFKVFAVVSVIFFLGGCPTFGQTEPECPLTKKIIDLIQEHGKSNTNDGKGMDEALIKLIKEVTEFISSDDDNNKLLEKLKELLRDKDAKRPKPNNDNKNDNNELLEKLKELLRNKDTTPPKPNNMVLEEGEVKTLLTIINKLSVESMKDIVPQIIENLKQRKTFHVIIHDIIYRLKGEEKTYVMKIYHNYVLGMPATKPKEDDHEEPMTDRDVCKNKPNPEISHLLKMLKSSSWQNLFKNEYDKSKYTEMVQYIEESTGPSAWTYKLMSLGKDSDWLWRILEQFVYMLENNSQMRDQLKTYIQRNKELDRIMMKAAHFFKYQDYEKFSPLVQKIIFIVKELCPPHPNDNRTEVLFESYMNWVDCNFDEQEGMASILKTLGVLLQNKQQVNGIFDNMTCERNPGKINIKLLVKFQTQLKCSKMVDIVRQSLENVIMLVTRKSELCSYTSVGTTEIDSKKYVRSLGNTNNVGNLKWKVHVLKDGQTIHEDVDLSYEPEDGETILFEFKNTSIPP